MKVAYFDCFSGVSGDMTLGALLACGADESEFRERLGTLNVAEYELRIQTVKPEGVTATDVDVRLLSTDQGHGRHLSDISNILKASTLPVQVKQNALDIFTRLADAEAKIHGTSRNEIHFHEVGAVDAIVDIVGACLLLDMLGVEAVVTSSLPCGYGTITCQHGIMPIPAPATMELLQGFPVHSVDIKGELVTPTGAALLTTPCDPASAGRMPAMRVRASGFGAGKKQFKPDMPNLLRVILGDTVDAPAHDHDIDRLPQTVAVLETSLDDQNPEGLGLVMERAFAAGAVDVFFTPIQMKKSRPATLLTVLCPPDRADTLTTLLFQETSTFGIRVREQHRFTLERSWRTVTTEFGDIRLKAGTWQGEEVTVSPEYEDCCRVARDHAVPLRRVYEAALRHKS